MGAYCVSHTVMGLRQIAKHTCHPAKNNSTSKVQIRNAKVQTNNTGPQNFILSIFKPVFFLQKHTKTDVKK